MTTKHDLSEQTIQEFMALDCLDRGHRFVVPNSNVGQSEADLVSLTHSMYLYEYEIKLSRDDYNAERRAFESVSTDENYRSSGSKRLKHRVIYERHKDDGNSRYENYSCPSKYYLVCPEGLVNADEIPDIWGLYTIQADDVFNEVSKAKKAKRIHRNNATYKQLLKMTRELSNRYWYDY